MQLEFLHSALVLELSTSELDLQHFLLMVMQELLEFSPLVEDLLQLTVIIILSALVLLQLRAVRLFLVTTLLSMLVLLVLTLHQTYYMLQKMVMTQIMEHQLIMQN